ncbi:MAG TPA: ribosome-associated translation inhibitor RaiA [Nitrospirales bacterium]|nr:ribosome-associated translation inhibitor RaiA [Nitrospirales bacterium]
MAIHLTGRHVELDDALRDYVDKKVRKLEQHGARLHDVSVILGMEKYRAVAEVSINVDGHSVIAKDETKELYQSIDGVMEKIERQMMRYRGKRVKDKVRATASRPDAVRDAVDENSNHRGVETRKVSVPSMSTEDALAMMTSTESNCMVFSDRGVGMLRIVHRRANGEIEIIDPVT